jgi:hypothetical protein
MAFAVNTAARLLLTPRNGGPLTTRQASPNAADRQVAPPNGAFDTGLRPDPFPDRAASLLPSLLAATRTGLTPAGDDELMLDHDLHIDLQLWVLARSGLGGDGLLIPRSTRRALIPSVLRSRAIEREPRLAAGCHIESPTVRLHGRHTFKLPAPDAIMNIALEILEPAAVSITSSGATTT